MASFAASPIGLVTTPAVSLVVPVFRNGDTLPELSARVRAVFDRLRESYELIFVVDASPDDAEVVALSLSKQSLSKQFLSKQSLSQQPDGEIRVLSLPRNVGQNAALLAGFAIARGDWVVALDGDLQDPPEAIPELLRVARAGHEVVFAGRRGRYQSQGRMFSSRIYKRTLHLLCGLPPDAGLYFAAGRRAVDELLRRRSETWILPILGLSGLPMTSLPVERDVRSRGTSAYSSWGRLRVAVPPIVYAARRRLRSWVPAIAMGPAGVWSCFLLALAGYLSMVFEPPFNLSDEGFRYLLARSWARGENLFARFQVLYPTGQYAYFGTWMKLLGEDLWVLRLGRAVLGAASAVCFFSTLRRLAPASVGLATVTWATVFAFVIAVPPQAKVLATTVVILLGLRLTDERVGRSHVLSSALAAGLLAGWREDSAVLALGIAVLAVVLRGKPGELLKVAAPAAMAGFVPWLCIEALRGDAGSFVRHVGFRLRFLVERLGRPTDVRWQLPLGAPDSAREALAQSMPILVSLPVLAYGLLLWLQVRRRRARKPLQRQALAAGCLGFAYLPQFVWERPDLPHFVYHLPLFLLAVAALGSCALPPAKQYLAAILPALVGLGLVLVAATRDVPPNRPYPCCGGERFGLRLASDPPWAGLDRRPGETLIVLGWSPGWYAVEDLEPGTRFLSTFRRHVSPELEAELVSDLGRPANRWVIDSGIEAPASARKALRAGYCRIGTWGQYQLWEHCVPEYSAPEYSVEPLDPQRRANQE